MLVSENIRQMEGEAYRQNVRLIAHHDLNGHGDGMQVIKVGSLLYVAHLGTSDMALSILDVADPENPRLLRQLPHPDNTHRHKVQIVGNVMIQNNEVPNFRDRSAKGTTGLSVYNLDDPTDPREIGFLPVPGYGVHRLWYNVDSAPYAHIAAFVSDRTRGYMIVDLSDPTNPREVGRWWVPGTMPGDPDPWPQLSPKGHYNVHGAIPHGDRAYVSCVDAGMAIVDISNLSDPRTVGHINWHPPFGGYSHTSLPLPGRNLVLAVSESVKRTCEEDGDKRIWVIDVREERQPVIISSFPRPRPPKGAPWDDFCDRPEKFGPHNVHENRPGSFQSETRIYATWFNAGLRIFDLSDADRPEEIGYFIPPPPSGQDAPMLNDLFVDVDGLIYTTDRLTGGLYVLEYTGG